MNDLESLWAACLASPTDNALRLAYTDLLEENGRRAEADMIRASIAGNVNQGKFRRRGDSWEGFPADGHIWPWIGRETDMKLVLGAPPRDLSVDIWLVFVRGLVGGVESPCDLFFRPNVAARLFARHPIEFVTLTDRKPMITHTRSANYLWLRGALSVGSEVGATLPEFVFDKLVGAGKGKLTMKGTGLAYGSPDDARAALSQQCVIFGRNTRSPAEK